MNMACHVPNQMLALYGPFLVVSGKRVFSYVLVGKKYGSIPPLQIPPSKSNILVHPLFLYQEAVRMESFLPLIHPRSPQQSSFTVVSLLQDYTRAKWPGMK